MSAGDERARIARASRPVDVEVRFIEAEALRVGLDEVIVVKLGREIEPEEMDAMLVGFEQIGLGGRVLIVASDIELAVVQRSTLLAASPVPGWDDE